MLYPSTANSKSRAYAVSYPLSSIKHILSDHLDKNSKYLSLLTIWVGYKMFAASSWCKYDVIFSCRVISAQINNKHWSKQGVHLIHHHQLLPRKIQIELRIKVFHHQHLLSSLSYYWNLFMRRRKHSICSLAHKHVVILIPVLQSPKHQLYHNQSDVPR